MSLDRNPTVTDAIEAIRTLREERVLLGVFEEANREDFMDALPLYIIKERGTIGQISYATINCSAGFRYVRYVGPVWDFDLAFNNDNRTYPVNSKSDYIYLVKPQKNKKNIRVHAPPLPDISQANCTILSVLDNPFWIIIWKGE